MKKLVMLFMMVSIFGSSLFISCSTIEEGQVSMKDQLMHDQEFADASKQTLDFMITAVENDWLKNISKVKAIIGQQSIEQLSQTDLARINVLLGMDIEEYANHAQSLARSLSNVYDNYPQLIKMSNAEQNQLFAEVLSSTNVVSLYASELQANNRDFINDIFCFLHGVCTDYIGEIQLQVDAVLDPACDFLNEINLPIPDLDLLTDIVCNILPDYISSYLTAVCDSIPCD